MIDYGIIALIFIHIGMLFIGICRERANAVIFTFFSALVGCSAILVYNLDMDGPSVVPLVIMPFILGAFQLPFVEERWQGYGIGAFVIAAILHGFALPMGLAHTDFPRYVDVAFLSGNLGVALWAMRYGLKPECLAKTRVQRLINILVKFIAHFIDPKNGSRGKVA